MSFKRPILTVPSVPASQVLTQIVGHDMKILRIWCLKALEAQDAHATVIIAEPGLATEATNELPSMNELTQITFDICIERLHAVLLPFSGAYTKPGTITTMNDGRCRRVKRLVALCNY